MKNVLIFEVNQQLAGQSSQLIAASFPELSCCICTSAKEAHEQALIDYRSVIVINLDLPDGEGLQFALWLRKIPVYRQTPIIFVAASVEFSVAAINQVKCLNYILWPNLAAELPRAIAEALTLLVAGVYTAESDYINLSTKGARFKIKLADIIYIEINNKVAAIVTTEHSFQLKRVSLQLIEDQLPEMMFQQCHRSYIVNIAFISSVESMGRSTVLRLKNIEQPIPVGIRYLERFISR
jgi:two-component system response regulator LytT